MQQHGHGEADAVKIENVSTHSHQDLAEAYQAMLGRSRTEISFTDEGMTIDSRMTFK